MLTAPKVVEGGCSTTGDLMRSVARELQLQLLQQASAILLQRASPILLARRDLKIFLPLNIPALLPLLLQAIQYVQANPDEVCPAGWKPGQKTMKPDPKVGQT